MRDELRLALVDDLARCRISGAGRIPGAAVPGPRDALGVEPVADRRQRLRGQDGRLRRVGVARVAARRRQDATRLITRLHCVDRVEHAGRVLGRQRTVAFVARRAGKRAARRVGGRGQAQEPAFGIDVDRRNKSFCRRAIGIRIFGRAGADQVLVIEERAAERAHEEVVGERVLARHLPHRHVAAVVVAHRERAGIGVRSEEVIAAAVDLHDVVVEAVHEIACRHPDRRAGAAAVERVGAVDAERPVRQADRLGLGHDRRPPDCRQAAPDGRQHRQHRTVDIALRQHRAERARVAAGDAVGAGKEAVEGIEGAVLGVDDDQRVDGVDAVAITAGRWRRRQGNAARSEQREAEGEQSW